MFPPVPALRQGRRGAPPCCGGAAGFPVPVASGMRIGVRKYWLLGRRLFLKSLPTRRQPMSELIHVYISPPCPPHRRCFSASWCMHTIFIMASQMERKNSIASTTSSASTNTLRDSSPLGQTGEVRKAAELLFGLSEASAGEEWFPACQKSVDSNNSEGDDGLNPSQHPTVHNVSNKHTASVNGWEHQENRLPLSDISHLTSSTP